MFAAAAWGRQGLFEGKNDSNTLSALAPILGFRFPTPLRRNTPMFYITGCPPPSFPCGSTAGIIRYHHQPPNRQPRRHTPGLLPEFQRPTCVQGITGRPGINGDTIPPNSSNVHCATCQGTGDTGLTLISELRFGTAAVSPGAGTAGVAKPRRVEVKRTHTRSADNRGSPHPSGHPLGASWWHHRSWGFEVPRRGGIVTLRCSGWSCGGESDQRATT